MAKVDVERRRFAAVVAEANPESIQAHGVNPASSAARIGNGHRASGVAAVVQPWVHHRSCLVPWVALADRATLYGMRHRYFNHSATSYPKPASVGEAMAAAVNGPPLGVGRAAGEGPDDLLERLRMRLCRFVGGDAPERLIFAACATDALNTAILGLLGGLSGPTEGEALPHVVCSDVDHNSMRRPLNALAAARRIELTRVPCDEQGFVDPDDIAAALKPHTALVTITHGSNVLGSVQDVPGIASRVRRDGEALILLDAAQTAGLLPLDVQAMEVDVVAFPGHKALLGPMGTGVLYVGDPDAADASGRHRDPLRRTDAAPGLPTSPGARHPQRGGPGGAGSGPRRSGE